MSRILKSNNISMNKNEKISIEINDYFTPKNITIGSMVLAEEDISEERIIEMAKIEADQIVSSAQFTAKHMLSDAKTQSEVLAKDIFDKAEQKGYEDGYNKGLNDADAIKEKAEQLYVETLEQRDIAIASLEPELVDLTVSILDKLFMDTIVINPQVIVCLIKQGILNSNMTGDISIHISDEDFETVTENRASILDLFSSSSRVEFVKDVGLRKAECIIETSFGSVNCSFDEQYTDLKRNLYYIMENR